MHELDNPVYLICIYILIYQYNHTTTLSPHPFLYFVKLPLSHPAVQSVFPPFTTASFPLTGTLFSPPGSGNPLTSTPFLNNKQYVLPP
jgi:hypothetical protein